MESIKIFYEIIQMSTLDICWLQTFWEFKFFLKKITSPASGFRINVIHLILIRLFTNCLQIRVIKMNQKDKNIWLKINTKNAISQANYANQKNVNTKIKPQSLKVFRFEWTKYSEKGI